MHTLNIKKSYCLFFVYLCSPDGLIEKASILFGIDFDDTKLEKMKELLQIIQEKRHNVSKTMSIINKYILACVRNIHFQIVCYL